LTLNGETNAYSEEEDDAPARSKREPVHRSGDWGDGPQGGRKRARVTHWQGARADKDGRAPAQRLGQGPVGKTQTRASRTEIQHPRVLRYGGRQIRHFLADEDTGRSPRNTLQGRGTVFRRDWRRANFDPEGTQALASSLYYALLHSEYLRLWVERSVWAREGDAARHLDNLTRLATEHFLAGRLRETNKKLVGDKSPLLNADFIEEVSRIYPEARVIHIVRDGRDQAVSMLHHVWNRSTDQGGVQTLKPGEFERREAYRKDPKKLLQTGEGMFTEERLRGAARSWNARVGKTAQDGPALLGPNYTEVRYEDLLERPNEEVGRLAGFLGADTREKAVQQAVDSASFEKLSKGRERGQEDTSSFYRKGIAGDWNNYFTERDKEIYKEEAGELLIRLGYERDLDW
jgi:hypothetical protein